MLHFVGREDVLQRIDEIFGVGYVAPSDDSTFSKTGIERVSIVGSFK